MNEEGIQEIVARTYEEVDNPLSEPEIWEDAIENAISSEVGQDVQGVLAGVVEEVVASLPDPDWGFLDDYPEGEERDEAFHDHQRTCHEQLVAAIALAIMARLQDAGFLEVPPEA